MKPEHRRILVGGGAALGIGWAIHALLRGGWINAALTDLEKWEGLITWPYLDTKGLVTVGIGNMIPTVDRAFLIPWTTTGGRRATVPEIRAAWAKLKAAKPAMGSRAYLAITPLRISRSFARELARRRVENEFVPALRQLYPAFDSFPSSAKAALLDMIYSLGKAGLAKYNTLAVALNVRRVNGRPDFSAASLAMGRRGARPERDENNRRRMAAAA